MSECQAKEQLTAAMKDIMHYRDRVHLGTIARLLSSLSESK
ncbi:MULTISPECIES: hypothetical protein [unclassified Endozoicomonas]|nr:MULTISPECIES: hypothetical protein [unclassified Endozoicomonas]